MTCSSCEERRKLLKEAAEATARGDFKLAQDKIAATVASFKKPTVIITAGGGFLGATRKQIETGNK